jgi:acyl-CoA thioester hydrolase
MTKQPEKKGVIKARVYYEDTDAGGVVYHANMIKFAERGRTEWLRESGYDAGRLLAELGIILVVRHVDIEYLAPGRLDDLLVVESKIAAVGNTSLAFNQTIFRENEKGTKTLAELKVTVVAIKPSGQAVRIPPQLRQIFSRVSGTESSKDTL